MKKEIKDKIQNIIKIKGTRARKINNDNKNFCTVCEEEFCFTWGLEHGIGNCIYCGSPYKVLHYDKNNNLKSTEPELLLQEKYIRDAKEFYNETGKKLQEGFDEWMNENKKD